MGREAECMCRWDDHSATVKALLEADQLILRGAIPCKVPFSKMDEVRAEDGKLLFGYNGADVCLVLGEGTAWKWRQIILAPPVTLAKKLGISPETFVWSLGEVNDTALTTALSTARGLKADGADVIVASIASTDALAKVLGKTALPLSQGVPLWIIYPKGKGHAVDEAAVRSAARAIGLIDTKVASVSAALTGLRFVLKK